MNEIEGITVGVSSNGRILKVQDDGYLGSLSLGQALIQVSVLPARRIYGFSVDGKKNVVLLKNRTAPGEPPEYQASIQVKKAEDEVLRTEYPQNHLRLLELDNGGSLRIWEIALISQNGNFFRTIQQTYEAQCYRDRNRIACPKFAEWPQMVELLAKLLEKDIEKLAPVTDYQPDSEPSSEGIIEKNTGRALWWDYAMGFGAIITKQGGARVHWKQIDRPGRLSYLTPGELVSYERLRPPRQTKARDTSFRQEAIKVTPL